MRLSIRATRAAASILAALALAALACNLPAAEESNPQATVQSVYATITAHAAAADVPVTTTATIAAPTEPPDNGIETPVPAETATASPTPPSARTGNGTNLTFPRCGGSLIVDGSPADWQALSGIPAIALNAVTYGASQWTGPEDLSGTARVCWTDSALYLFVDVIDDIHVQTQRGSTSWKGDEVELLFDGDLEGDFYVNVWNDDDVQLGLSPGDFADLPPAVVRYHPSFRDLVTVDIAARRPEGAAGGYQLEAAIPWSTLGVTPSGGARYGFCLALSDNDQVGQASQDSMVSHCVGLRVFDPTTWVTAELTD